MWPLSTVTEPKRASSASACAESCVPQPHSGAIVHSGMCANTTIGVDGCLRLQVVGEPGELLGAEIAHAAGLEIDDVDEADEVHAGLVERIPAGALRALAVALEIGLAVVLVDDVVFARHVMRVET